MGVRLVLLVLLIGSCADSSTSTPSTPPSASEESVGPGDVVSVVPVTYKAKAPIRDKIKTECVLESHIRTHIVNAAGARAKASDEASGGKRLSVQIVGVDAPGGGIYSGTKVVLIEGTLSDGGATIGSFTARRTTMGGALAPVKGTCAMLQRIAEALGQDVAGWLRKPTKDARLGELGAG